MSGFLQALARLAVGEAITVRPRPRARFEPGAGPVLGPYALTDRQPGSATAHPPTGAGHAGGPPLGLPAPPGTGPGESWAVPSTPDSTPPAPLPAGPRPSPLTGPGRDTPAADPPAHDPQGGSPAAVTAAVSPQKGQTGADTPGRPADAPGARPGRPAGSARVQDTAVRPTPPADPVRHPRPVTATPLAVTGHGAGRPVVSGPDAEHDGGSAPAGPDGLHVVGRPDGHGSEGLDRAHEPESRTRGSAAAAGAERAVALPGGVGRRTPPAPPASRAATVPAADTARTEPSASPPPVVVSVGRIEIHAVTRPTPPSAPAAPPERASTAPALDRYLARLEGGA